MTRSPFLALPLIVACGLPFGLEDADLPLLQTDQVEYALQVTDAWAELDVLYTFSNRSDVTVYVGGCRSAIVPVFERLENGVWIFAYQGPSLDCGANPIAIPPGGHVNEIASIWLVREPGHTNSYVPGTVEGEYRLRWAQASVVPFGGGPPPSGNLLPLRLSVSNTFWIREP